MLRLNLWKTPWPLGRGETEGGNAESTRPVRRLLPAQEREQWLLHISDPECLMDISRGQERPHSWRIVTLVPADV